MANACKRSASLPEGMCAATVTRHFSDTWQHVQENGPSIPMSSTPAQIVRLLPGAYGAADGYILTTGEAYADLSAYCLAPSGTPKMSWLNFMRLWSQQPPENLLLSLRMRRRYESRMDYGLRDPSITWRLNGSRYGVSFAFCPHARGSYFPQGMKGQPSISGYLSWADCCSMRASSRVLLRDFASDYGLVSVAILSHFLGQCFGDAGLNPGIHLGRWRDWMRIYWSPLVVVDHPRMENSAVGTLQDSDLSSRTAHVCQLFVSGSLPVPDHSFPDDLPELQPLFLQMYSVSQCRNRELELLKRSLPRYSPLRQNSLWYSNPQVMVEELLVQASQEMYDRMEAMDMHPTPEEAVHAAALARRPDHRVYGRANESGEWDHYEVKMHQPASNSGNADQESQQPAPPQWTELSLFSLTEDHPCPRQWSGRRRLRHELMKQHRKWLDVLERAGLQALKDYLRANLSAMKRRGWSALPHLVLDVQLEWDPEFLACLRTSEWAEPPAEEEEEWEGAVPAGVPNGADPLGLPVRTPPGANWVHQEDEDMPSDQDEVHG